MQCRHSGIVVRVTTYRNTRMHYKIYTRERKEKITLPSRFRRTGGWDVFTFSNVPDLSRGWALTHMWSRRTRRRRSADEQSVSGTSRLSSVARGSPSGPIPKERLRRDAVTWRAFIIFARGWERERHRRIGVASAQDATDRRNPSRPSPEVKAKTHVHVASASDEQSRAALLSFIHSLVWFLFL